MLPDHRKDVEVHVNVQAWMVSQAPVTQHAFLQSTPKVHSGFHAAWHVSGLQAAVTQLIKDKIQRNRPLI